MIFEFIAVIVAGFAGGGSALLLRKITGNRLPRWLTPILAGGAMLAATITNEYGWYQRTAMNLPEGLVVAQTETEDAFYRPWTYAFPYIDRFLAVDTQSIRTNETMPGTRLADVYAFGRWRPPSRITVAFDCDAGRMAEMTEGVSFDAGGRIEGARWAAAGDEEPLLDTACAGRG